MAIQNFYYELTIKKIAHEFKFLLRIHYDYHDATSFRSISQTAKLKKYQLL